MGLKDNRKITELSVSEFTSLIKNAVDKEYSIEEAADYLGCGKTKIYELVNSNELRKMQIICENRCSLKYLNVELQHS